MRRPLAALAVWIVTLALVAPVALANDHGQGLYGETNDKVVTNAGFILIAFFPALVLVLSVIQGRLDKRKKARLAAQKARAVRQRNGW
jgi:preprotein translocase subunit SecG